MQGHTTELSKRAKRRRDRPPRPRPSEGELARDAGLSDPRLAHDEHDRAIASDCPIERTRQATGLDLASDEQIAHPGGYRQARNHPRVPGPPGADIAHLLPFRPPRLF